MYLENRRDTLASGISYSAEPVPRDGTSYEAGYVGDDEAQRAAAHATDHAPKLARGPVGALLGHAFLAHHLLEDVAELRILGSLPLLAALVGEEVPGPRVVICAAAAAAGLWGHLFIRIGEGI